MQSDSTDRELRVSFYARSFTPAGVADRQHAILERLQQLHEQGPIDACEHDVWGTCVDIAETRPGAFGNDAIETVARFREWADRNEVSLSPCFEERTHRSKITGEHSRELVFPVMCLAVYQDDELVGVYPHVDDEGVVTIDEFLESLASNDVLEPGRPVV